MAKISFRIPDDLEAWLDAEATRTGVKVSAVIRRCIEAVKAHGTSAPVTVDPVLQAMADGIRREAASRELSPEMVITLWFNMMRPILPKPNPGLFQTNITKESDRTHLMAETVVEPPDKKEGS